MTTEPDLDAAATPPDASRPAPPVSAARRGYSPAQVAGFHAGWDWRDVLQTGDASLYMFLHPGEFYPSTVVPRSGPDAPLGHAPDPRVGAVRLPSPGTAASPGGPALDEYLGDPGSRAQGMIAVCRGEVVFERYPGMRDDDAHLTMSVAKTMPALLVGLLEEEGKVDVRAGVGAYVPALADTAWRDVPVADVLDMASGLDVEETDRNRDDPRSTFGRFLRAVLGVPGAGGAVERPTDVIRSAARLREPGRVFEYSSLNTQVLVLLAEAVEGRPWPDVFRDRVWSRVAAEGDATVLVSPDGVALPFGFVAVRLRDLARYGMLYTPSWGRAARGPVVPAGLIDRIRASAWAGRGAAATRANAPGDAGRHWDGVREAGGMYKTGLHGQGLYVSPGKDLVIAWFSTAPASDLPAYALRVAKLFGRTDAGSTVGT